MSGGVGPTFLQSSASLPAGPESNAAFIPVVLEEERERWDSGEIYGSVDPKTERSTWLSFSLLGIWMDTASPLRLVWLFIQEDYQRKNNNGKKILLFINLLLFFIIFILKFLIFIISVFNFWVFTNLVIPLLFQYKKEYYIQKVFFKKAYFVSEWVTIL